MMTLVHWFLWLIIYSFLGWIYESALVSSREKRFVNRGFLTGPILPVYGFGGLLSVFFMYGRIENFALLFIMGAVFSTVLEYFTSWILEKLFKARWWDYTDQPFNLHGRVFLLGAVVFGFMSAVVVKYVHPLVVRQLGMVPDQFLIAVSAVIFIVMMIDLQNTVSSLLRMNSKLRELRLALDAFQSEQQLRMAELRSKALNRLEPVELYQQKLSRAYEVFRSGQQQRMADLRSDLLDRFEQTDLYQRQLRRKLEDAAKRTLRLARAYPRLRLLEYEEAWERLTRDVKNSFSRKDKK